MDKKLTLSLDAEVIEAGKRYAKARGTSLSKLFRAYLERLTAERKGEVAEIPSPWDELVGVVDLPEGKDWKEVRYEYLLKKHS